MNKRYDRIGERGCTNEGYISEIISYRSTTDIDVILCDGTVLTTTYNMFKKGSIKNPYHKSVYGVGCFGVGKHKAKINNKFTKKYETWNSMISRCYNQKRQEKYPAYKDVTVCEEWHNFQNFGDWFEENWKPYMKGWHLDKDIICPDCKVYSPNTCAFIPRVINNLFVSDKREDIEEIGIKFAHNKYYLRVPTPEGRKHLGVFTTIEEARLNYKRYKKLHIKIIVDKYKELINYNVYSTLIKFIENE